MKTSAVRRRLKLPAAALVIALLLTLLPVSALAYVEDVVAYAYYPDSSVNAVALNDIGGAGDEAVSIGEVVAQYNAQANPDIDLGYGLGGAWMYTVNGVLSSCGPSYDFVKDGDVVCFYFVPDYATNTLAMLNDYGLIVISGRLKVLASTNYPVVGQKMSLNADNPFVEPESSILVNNSQVQNINLASSAYLYISSNSSGVLPTFIPADVVNDFDVFNNNSAAVAELNAMLDKVIAIGSAITSTEVGGSSYATLQSLISDAQSARALGDAYAEDKALAKIALGEYINYLISQGYTSDARLNSIVFTASVAPALPYDSTPGLVFDPASSVFRYDRNVTDYNLFSACWNGTMPTTFTATASAPQGASVSYSDSGAGIDVNQNGVVTLSASGTHTLTVTVTNGGNSRSYDFTFNYETPSAGGATPSDDNGYLPVGQFATGSSWGSMYSDGTNQTGNTEKFLSGYLGTGVSLGMLGGYIQFEFPNGIENAPTNPYGIDFIVYGNAFPGTPEAGSVMVSAGAYVNGEWVIDANSTWYALAGSLHYDTGDTTWNNKVSYAKLTAPNTNLDPAFDSAGIYYSMNFDNSVADNQAAVDGAIGAAAWTRTSTAPAWWPEYSGEYYSRVWSQENISGVTWHRNGSADVVTYAGLRRVKDDAEKGLSGNNATDYYRFGYVDVRRTGNSYGTAVNPYASLPSSNPTAGPGGDGFDLAWAVDANGCPVGVGTVHFVRVYTSVLYNTGVFGETSTEVCGIYTAAGTGSGAATTDLEVYIDNPNYDEIPTANMTTQTVYQSQDSQSYDIYSDEDYVFVNGTSVSCTSNTPYSFNVTLTSPGATAYYQIITQSGTESPYITLLKIVRT